MTSTDSFAFGSFRLDPDDRRLWRDGAPVELNARYLDALILLVREPGALVTKDRFMDDVWRGVPVTDEALTQCIRTLRRQLGDDAARPRFIETVPKHGYRFIAAVEAPAVPAPDRPVVVTSDAAPALGDRFFRTGGAGTLGAALAGVVGGLIYGFVGAAQPVMGAISVVLVLTCVTAGVALLGGAGVAFGIAAAERLRGRMDATAMAGGAVGGLVVGGLVKLIGIDAFSLLVGQSPGDVTGAAEGLALGAAVGAGAWLGRRIAGPNSLRRAVAIAAIATGATATLIVAAGGQLLGGSLALLAQQFPHSRLRLDQVGALLGEDGFGPLSQMVTGALEGGLFGGSVVAAMVIAHRRGRARPAADER